MRLFIIFLLLSFGLSAQIGTGQWRLHVPPNRAIDIVSTGDRVFTAFETGLSEYEFSTNEISVWDAVNSLSDITIACLGYSSATNSLFIGYENGNIDKIKNNSVINIPAIKLAELPGSKRINKIREYNSYIYMATGFSIVKIDPVKNEVRDTYYPTNGNQPILDIAFRNDSIFALASDKLYRGYINNVALADPAQWSIDTRVPELSANNYQDIEKVGDSLFLVLKVDGFGLDSVYNIRNTGLSITTLESFPMEIRSLNCVQGKLAVNYFDITKIYNDDYSIYNVIGAFNSGGGAKVNAMVYENNFYWLADDELGLVKYFDFYENGALNFIGPPNNEFATMDWYNGKLAVASGALKSMSESFYRSGVYIFENEGWILKDENNMSLWTGQNIWDYIAVSINPKDDNMLAVASYSQLPLSVLDMDGVVTATYSPSNSILETTSLGNGSSLVSDVKYDDAGNLWILNGYSNSPLKVLTTDNQWYEFDMGVTAKSKFTDNIVVDYNGNKWMSIRGAGMYGYNDNGTISSANDDEYVLLNSGASTGNLPSNQVNAIAVDFDNEIWIGTDNGFAVLYNSDGAFGASAGDYNAQRIKLEYEGNVEYVLGATDITDIEVDGANRKWFGTSNSGIILLSADGLEIIEQHTTENSPLISNNILDLELDQKTGELFIITDLGLVSYRTDATYEDPDYNDVVVFPNPARPDFDGPITIQGIRYNSDVRITDIAGNLVYKTTSNGGTATWNGKTLQGERVAAGVYLIWTAANEGKGRFVGKVLVVN